MRHDLPFLEAGQAQKEITHNQAIERISYLLHPSIVGPAMTTPPPNPASDACFLVAANATGAWQGRDGQIACSGAGGWLFFAPSPGMTIWDQTADSFGFFDGVSWKLGGWAAAEFAVNGVKVVGAQQPGIANPSAGGTIDAQARTSIIQILNALRAHGLIAA